MLVLSRKQDQTIRIGDDIVVHVIATGRGTVRIGIEAPREVAIRRGELPAIKKPICTTVSPEATAAAVA